LLDSIKWIEELIKEEVDKGILPQNVFIAGISQGGSLALAIAMSSQYELGGFVGLGSFLPYPKILKRAEKGKNKQTPIFMAHGQEDKLVPYEAAQKSFQILKQNGYRQIKKPKVYPGLGHESQHFLPMIKDGLGFFEKIFQTKNLPKLIFLDPKNVVIVRK